MIATCSSGGYFPKIVEWSFLQQGRSVWRKIPGEKRKPFVTGFTNKLQITEAMKKLGRISELRFGEFWDKKCQQVRCTLALFSLPIVSRALSFSTLQLPFDTRGPRRKRRGSVEEKTLKIKTLDLESRVKYSDETELTTFDIRIRKRNQFGNELTKTRKCD